MVYDLSQAAPSVEFEGQVVVPTMSGDRVEVGFYDHFDACNAILADGDPETIALFNRADSGVSSYSYLFNIAVLTFARHHDEVVDNNDGTEVFNVSIECSGGDNVTIIVALPDGNDLACKLHTMVNSYTPEQRQAAITVKKEVIEVVI